MLNMLTRSLAAKKARLAEEEKGFTLIELLVVVIIIGILAAIAIPIFLGQQEQAKASAVESAITNAKTAVIAEMVELNKFPDGTTSPTLAEILDKAEGSPDITLTSVGGSSAFCIKGVHAGLPATQTYAADDKGGVIEGTCNATTFVAE